MDLSWLLGPDNPLSRVSTLEHREGANCKARSLGGLLSGVSQSASLCQSLPHCLAVL